MLATYDYELVYRPGKLHGNADFNSRMPLQQEPDESFSKPAGVYLLNEALVDSPLSAEKVASATREDPVLSQVVSGLLQGRALGVVLA